MLPRGERSEGSFFVKLGRSRNDDGFDLIRAKQFGNVFTDSRSRRPRRLHGALLIDIDDCDKFRAGDFG